MMMFIKWAISFLSGPIIKAGLDLYGKKLEAQGSHEAKTLELAARTLELDALEARLNNDRKSNILGHWHAPENLFAYLIAFPYWFTVITLDFLVFPALGIDHATGALKGETAAIMAMIMTFWFGKRTINTVASIIAQAFGKR